MRLECEGGRLINKRYNAAYEASSVQPAGRGVAGALPGDDGDVGPQLLGRRLPANSYRTPCLNRRVSMRRPHPHYIRNLRRLLMGSWMDFSSATVFRSGSWEQKTHCFWFRR